MEFIEENKIEIATPESIKSRIVKVRRRCVIIDSDLAETYGVETKNLKRTVRMNIERFPEDFMFVLTKEEYDSLRCNFFTLKNGCGQHSRGAAALRHYTSFITERTQSTAAPLINYEL